MKYIVIILISSVNLLAQINTIQVDYKFENNAQNSKTIFFQKLTDNGKYSLYITKDSTINNDPYTVVKKSPKRLGIFNDKVQNTLFMYSGIMGRDFYIKEDSITNKFQWVIVDSVKKTILNYNCKLALCKFRGREYRAFYTDELPFFSGPWKFGGLPGVILEVKSTNDWFSFEAYRISISGNTREINNPYTDEKIKFMPFIEHKKLSLRVLNAAQQKAQSQEKDDDVEYTFKDDSMELLK